jgi:hypothetical protein
VFHPCIFVQQSYLFELDGAGADGFEHRQREITIKEGVKLEL